MMFKSKSKKYKLKQRSSSQRNLLHCRIQNEDLKYCPRLLSFSRGRGPEFVDYLYGCLGERSEDDNEAYGDSDAYCSYQDVDKVIMWQLDLC